MKFQLKIGNFAGIPNGIGDGGSLLFGRSDDGKIFGKKLSSAGELLDLPNGNWTFYALFWDTSSTPMNGTVYCAIGALQLTGADAVLSMNATNGTCAQAEFSNGRHFVDANGKIRFPELLVEDCDVVPSSGYTCGLSNQGNALSYRYLFQEFAQGPGGFTLPINPGAPHYSSCQIVDESSAGNSLQNPAPINYPNGNGISPFQLKMEMFLGNTICDVSDPKGFYVHSFDVGFGVQIAASARMIESNEICAQGSSTYFAAGTADEKDKKCTDELGLMNAGSCGLSTFPYTIQRFLNMEQNGKCNNTTLTSPAKIAIKHLVAIPLSFLCDRYTGSSTQIGAHHFAAGDGSRFRPYKICTEWQINQIGEYNTSTGYSNKWYKLLKDLDMNLTDEGGTYAKPLCVGVGGSNLKSHHNFNPLDKIHTNAGCTTVRTTGAGYFQGVFNGNNLTIKNLRIATSSVERMGFVRELFDGAKIQNVNFVNLEVRGANTVGGVAGYVNPTSARLENITLINSEIDGESVSGASSTYVGSVAGIFMGTGATPSKILKVKVTNGSVRGGGNVGGLVGLLQGEIHQSSFRGTIRNDDSGGASPYIGGLAGSLNLSGSIHEAFSEGLIFTRSQYVGGIAGKLITAQSNLSDVYSTMAVRSSFSGANAHVSGIVGYSLGTINGAYFDGVLEYNGGGTTPNVFPIGVNGSGIATDFSNCYGAHAAMVASGTHNCSLTSATSFRSTFPTFVNSNLWQWTAGSRPRLAYEVRDCLAADNLMSVTTQVSNGRGSVANPIYICTGAQFLEMNGLPASYHYFVPEDLHLGTLTASSSIINFLGTIDGNHTYWYGFNRTYSSGMSIQNPQGIIETNQGTIKNVNVLQATLNSGGADSEDLRFGIFVGNNVGVLDGISVYFSSILGGVEVGGLSGENSGTIQNSKVSHSKIQGRMKVGGIAGVNNGSIRKVFFDGDLLSGSAAGNYTEFGGIAGSNASPSAIIDQAHFSGRFETPSNTSDSANGFQWGGISGTNYGTITNVLVDEHSLVKVLYPVNVGGLVGNNATTGSLTYGLFLGKLLYNNGMTALTNATNSPSFHPLVGVPNHVSTSGSGNITFSFYVQNSVGSITSSMTNIIGASGGNYTIGTAVTSLPSIADSLFTDQVTNLGLILAFPSTTNAFTSSTVIPNGASVVFTKLFDLTSALFLSWGIPSAGVPNETNYCSSYTSSSTGREVCISGFNIAFIDEANPASSMGKNRLWDYYHAVLNGTAIPADAPLWSLETGDKSPQLLQVPRSF